MLLVDLGVGMEQAVVRVRRIEIVRTPFGDSILIVLSPSFQRLRSSDIDGSRRCLDGLSERHLGDGINIKRLVATTQFSQCSLVTRSIG